MLRQVGARGPIADTRAWGRDSRKRIGGVKGTFIPSAAVVRGTIATVSRTTGTLASDRTG